mmetsp:Transcript_22374/g.57311  ORF Transcript_22374/g.57311 Transcript_22374/m.57311 type:complete len:264 (-) Transcript_22374:1542-2333(-)
MARPARHGHSLSVPAWCLHLLSARCDAAHLDVERVAAGRERRIHVLAPLLDALPPLDIVLLAAHVLLLDLALRLLDRLRILLALHVLERLPHFLDVQDELLGHSLLSPLPQINHLLLHLPDATMRALAENLLLEQNIAVHHVTHVELGALLDGLAPCLQRELEAFVRDLRHQHILVVDEPVVRLRRRRPHRIIRRHDLVLLRLEVLLRLLDLDGVFYRLILLHRHEQRAASRRGVPSPLGLPHGVFLHLVPPMALASPAIQLP